MMGWKAAALLEFRRITRNPGRRLSLVVLSLIGIAAVLSGQQHTAQWQAEGDALAAQREQAETDLLNRFENRHYGRRRDIRRALNTDRAMDTAVFLEPGPMALFSVGVSDVQGTWSPIRRNTHGRATLDKALIRNPEQLRVGVMDFAFVLVYLAPLLLIVLAQGQATIERSRGMLPMIALRLPPRTWLVTRMLTLWALVLGAMTVPLVVGGVLGGALWQAPLAWLLAFALTALWLLFWTALFGVILARATNPSRAGLLGLGLWILVVPVTSGGMALLLDRAAPVTWDPQLINGLREDNQAIYDLPTQQVMATFLAVYPDMRDQLRANGALQRQHMGRFYEVTAAHHQRMLAARLDEDVEMRAWLAELLSWINPASAMTLGFAGLAGTDEHAFLGFRAYIGEASAGRMEWAIRSTFDETRIDGDGARAEMERVPLNWNAPLRLPIPAFGSLLVLTSISAVFALQRFRHASERGAV